MIQGIGVDLADVEKVGKALSLHGEKFYSRVFSENERKAIKNAINKNEKKAFQKAAGYFAAKEAFLKALGAGLFSMPLNKIGILNAENGAPYINIDVETAGFLRSKFKKSFSSVKLSITHEKGFACAMVVLQ